MSGEREQILQRIRTGLSAHGNELREMAARTPGPNPAGPFVAPEPDLVEQFRAQFTLLRGYPHVCADNAEALAALREILTNHQATQVLTWDLAAIPLPGLEALLNELQIAQAPGQILGATDHAAAMARLGPVPVGISGVDAAVAESGTMIVVSGPGQGRLASLLPPTHVAIIPRDRIARSLPDGVALVRRRYGDALFRDHSNMTFITGPSRTADVGGEIVLGAHGPAEVHAIIV
jgi:L-lactate dehydrogenase complex protein LldG